jgi:hypothetical protein
MLARTGTSLTRVSGNQYDTTKPLVSPAAADICESALLEDEIRDSTLFFITICRADVLPEFSTSSSLLCPSTRLDAIFLATALITLSRSCTKLMVELSDLCPRVVSQIF